MTDFIQPYKLPKMSAEDAYEGAIGIGQSFESCNTQSS